MRWNTRYTWLAGLGIIILSNALALAGVAYNRSGDPGTLMTLTERELKLPSYRRLERESSGLGLELQWQINSGKDDQGSYMSSYMKAAWLGEDKLVELEFPVKEVRAKEVSQRRFNSRSPRIVFLVLEHNGAAYQDRLTLRQAYAKRREALARENPGDEKIIKEAEAAKKRLEYDQDEASRLFVVDAGLDPAVLRDRYPDKSHHMIVRGKIDARINKRKDGEWEVQGYVRDIAVKSINLPLEFREAFDHFMKKDHNERDKDVHYKVTLAYGKRFEPWVVGVQ